jgi:hypothetical protein
MYGLVSAAMHDGRYVSDCRPNAGPAPDTPPVAAAQAASMAGAASLSEHRNTTGIPFPLRLAVLVDMHPIDDLAFRRITAYRFAQNLAHPVEIGIVQCA